MFNLQTALETTDGDEELLRDVIEAFLVEYPQRLAELEMAFTKQDWMTARRAAHTIKGTLRIFGDDQSKQKAVHLETLCQADSSTDWMPGLRSLEQSLRELDGQLREYLRGASCP